MATNPMQRKTRNSFLLGIVITLIITGAIIGLLIMKLMDIQEEKELEEASYITVYVLNTDIKSGNEITVEDLIATSVVYSNAPTDYATPSDFTETTYAKFNMTSGTVLSKEMIFESEEEMSDSLRTTEYNMLSLPIDLETGDIIDIRLSLPSGTEYIVVSYKEVEIPMIGSSYSADTIIMELSEEEILMMSNAIVEAYQISGSKLYVSVYTDPGIQTAAEVTYPVNSAVKNLIIDNPNIVTEAKQALLDLYNDEQRTSVIDAEINSIISNGGSTDIQSDVQESVVNSQTAREEYLESLTGTY